MGYLEKRELLGDMRTMYTEECCVSEADTGLSLAAIVRHIRYQGMKSSLRGTLLSAPTSQR